MIGAPESAEVSTPSASRQRAASSPASGAAPPPLPGRRLIHAWHWQILFVVGGTSVAFFLRMLIARGHPNFAPFITFYPVVLLAALLAGLWAGILATVLSSLIAALWIFPHTGPIADDPIDIVSLVIFVVFGITLSIVIEISHRNRDRLARLELDQAVEAERRKLEREREVAGTIRAERRRLLDVLETLPSMISLLRPDHRVIFANYSFRQRFGDWNGRRCYEARFGRATPCADCETFLPLKTGEPARHEAILLDGSIIDTHDYPFTDLDGSSVVLEVGLDITARRIAEAELESYRLHLEELVRERTRLLEIANSQLATQLSDLETAQRRIAENQATLQAALASMTDSVIITDINGNFVDFNDAFATFYRFKNKADCTRNFSEFSSFFDIYLADGKPASTETLAVTRALRGEKGSNVEYSYRRRDTGETWTGSLSFGPIRDERGAISGAIITARDVTEAKRSEAALRESEKVLFERGQLQALAERMRMAREEELTRVSRDLHDQIGQILTAIKMDLAWARKRLPEGEMQRRLSESIEMVNEGVRSVRTICSGLRPGVLDDLGLPAAIEWQASDFTTRTGIRCEVSVPSFDLSLTPEQTTALFRIFQESLTNISRHAEATCVQVDLYPDDQYLVLEIADNGKGFSEKEASGSLGILGMKERARSGGGELQVIASPGNGATISVRIPVQVPHEAPAPL